MRHVQRLYRAYTWIRCGVTPKKAWELAAPTGRKVSSAPEALIIAALALAYALVAWNDAEAALDRMGYEYASSMMQKNKAEIALVNILSGKAMLIDAKTWTQCYSSTVM